MFWRRKNFGKTIKLTREHFRSIIAYNFRRGLWQECNDELKALFGDKARSYSIVKNWFNEFNCGQRSLKDEVCEGRPKTAVVSENIDAVHELIQLWTMVAKSRGPWRFSKNSDSTREHWCRACTDNARSSYDITWDKGILGHFFQQHTYNIAWTAGRKKGVFSLEPIIAQKSFVSIGVKKCWKNTIAVLQKSL